MSIDTEIEGSPASIRRVGGWLKDDVARLLDASADSLVLAARTAEDAWGGAAGEAFAGTTRSLVRPVDSARETTAEVGDTLVSYADRLADLQARMERQRERARVAGLTVNGFVIESPGAGPARPETPPANASQAQVSAFTLAVMAYDDHQDLIRAYHRIAERVAEIREDEGIAAESVLDVDRRLTSTQWGLILGDALSQFPQAKLKSHLKGAAVRAEQWHGRAVQSLEWLEGRERVPQQHAQRYYEDLRYARENVASSADDVAQVERWGKLAKGLGAGLGVAFGVGGVVYDMTREGEAKEGLTQAVASNGGSMAASMLTGAILGTTIGGPVGTVAGVVVGAGVGIFASGMIDGLWKYDGDVSDAFLAGVDSLGEAGGQVLSGAKDVGGAIVDGIGGWFD